MAEEPVSSDSALYYTQDAHAGESKLNVKQETKPAEENTAKISQGDEALRHKRRRLIFLLLGGATLVLIAAGVVVGVLFARGETPTENDEESVAAQSGNSDRRDDANNSSNSSSSSSSSSSISNSSGSTSPNTNTIEIVAMTTNATARELCEENPANYAADQGWYTPGNCFQYQLTEANQTWLESREICQENGADLAAAGIRNLTMRDAIVDAILGSRITWIGLTDMELEGTFVYLDKVEATQENTRWEEGEPSESNAGEDCGELNNPFHSKYTANDQACTDDSYGLCEKQIVVE